MSEISPIVDKHRKRELDIQIRMHTCLNHAVHAMEMMDGESWDLARKAVDGLSVIKFEINNEARNLGYARRCRAFIPICGGACCKWHYPKNLSARDFFIAICTLSQNELYRLIRHMEGFGYGARRCPFLCEDGCFFSFEDRPIVCTNAYPCFTGEKYWIFIEERKERVQAIFQDLGSLTGLK